jgi:hypothetical protein
MTEAILQYIKVCTQVLQELEGRTPCLLAGLCWLRRYNSEKSYPTR